MSQNCCVSIAVVNKFCFENEKVKEKIIGKIVEQTSKIVPGLIKSDFVYETALALNFGDKLNPLTVASLRPRTEIEGLYSCGQEMSYGQPQSFTGSLRAGLLCSGALLGRNTLSDLETLHDDIYNGDKKKEI